jgi:DHA2 family multidrug resistance protein
LTRTLAGSLAVAALGSFIVNREHFHMARFAEYVTQYSPIVNQRLNALQNFFMAHAGSAAAVAHQQALAVLQSSMFAQAAVMAFDDAFRVLTVAAALAVLVSFMARTTAASQRRVDRRIEREGTASPRPAAAIE